MSNVITPKGQVVVPPEHRESLKGVLAPYIRTHVPPGDEWRDVKERAWNDAVGARPVTRPRSK